MNPKQRKLFVLAAIAYHLVCMIVILVRLGVSFPKPVLAVMFIPQFIAAYFVAGMIIEKKTPPAEDELQRGLPGGRPKDRISPSLAALRAGRKSLDEEAEEAFAPVRKWGYRATLALLVLIIIWYYSKFVF